jgi:hypothetical protein
LRQELADLKETERECEVLRVELAQIERMYLNEENLNKQQHRRCSSSELMPLQSVDLHSLMNQIHEMRVTLSKKKAYNEELVAKSQML